MDAPVQQGGRTNEESGGSGSDWWDCCKGGIMTWLAEGSVASKLLQVMHPRWKGQGGKGKPERRWPRG